MQITTIGAAILLLGLMILWRGSTFAMFQFVLFATLMGGSAAANLPSLGGSTIPPAYVAAGFLFLRLAVPTSGQGQAKFHALKANMFLILFVVYGVLGALVLPHIFSAIIHVTPLRPNPTRDAFAVEPLRFTNQNITVPVYLIATLVAGVGSYVATWRRGSAQKIARTVAVIASTHAVLGLASVFLRTPLAPFFSFFRNGFYAQLDQSVSDFARMNGIFAEPAIFAAYGFAWFVFVTELWLRQVEPRWTGIASALLLMALVISTSSTAYLGLSAYGAILILRFSLTQTAIKGGQLLFAVAIGLLAIAAMLALLVIQPEVGAQLGRILSLMTADKLSSDSGIQRAFWAKQGYDAFVASSGLGIGAGSFRSSSLVTAIMGSMGLIGALSFIAHLLGVFMPWRRSTWLFTPTVHDATGAAASWAALIMLIPASFSAASPDPGIVWAAICGLALGYRQRLPSSNPSQLHDSVTPMGNQAGLVDPSTLLEAKWH